MHHSTSAPYEDGDEVTLLGAHPVDELTREQVSDSIEQGEETRNRTIVGIRPVEVYGDKVFPCERQDLTVHIVNGGCQEEQRTDDPAEVGHLSSLYRSHSYLISITGILSLSL